MKELFVPITPKNYVSLLDIDNYFSGVIICYKKDIPVGFIVKYDNIWFYCKNIDVELANYSDDNLYSLVIELYSKSIVDKFKIIEFKDVN